MTSCQITNSLRKCKRIDRRYCELHSLCLRFRLRLSLSLNGQMAIQRQNSRRITIRPFRKGRSNGRMATEPEVFRKHIVNKAQDSVSE